MRNKFDEQLSQLNHEMIEMGALCEEVIALASRALTENDKSLAARVAPLDSEIDRKERDIENLCLKLLLQQQPVASDLRLISSVLKMITDIERIGDQASDIAEIVTCLSGACGHNAHIDQMAQATIKMVTDSLDAFVRRDLTLAWSVIEYDDVVDRLFDECKQDLIAEIAQNPTDGERVLDVLMIAKYLERIGDHAVNLLRVAREIHDKDLKFSEKAQQELEVFTGAIIEILNITTDAFVENNLQLSYEVEPLEQVIDSLKVELKNRHIRRLQEGKCTIELGFVLSDILNNFERVSDHCSNIAVCLIQIKDSTMDTHGYLNEIKTSGDPRFTGYYNRFTSKYTLPESRHKKAPQEVPVKS